MPAKRATVKVAEAVLAKKIVARAVAMLAKRVETRALTRRATAKPLLQCHQHQLSILRLT